MDSLDGCANSVGNAHKTAPLQQNDAGLRLLQQHQQMGLNYGSINPSEIAYPLEVLESEPGRMGMCYVTERPEGLSIDCNVDMPNLLHFNNYEPQMIYHSMDNCNDSLTPMSQSLSSQVMPIPAAYPCYDTTLPIRRNTDAHAPKNVPQSQPFRATSESSSRSKTAPVASVQMPQQRPANCMGSALHKNSVPKNPEMVIPEQPAYIWGMIPITKPLQAQPSILPQYQGNGFVPQQSNVALYHVPYILAGYRTDCGCYVPMQLHPSNQAITYINSMAPGTFAAPGPPNQTVREASHCDSSSFTKGTKNSLPTEAIPSTSKQAYTDRNKENWKCSAAGNNSQSTSQQIYIDRNKDNWKCSAAGNSSQSQHCVSNNCPNCSNCWHCSRCSNYRKH